MSDGNNSEGEILRSAQNGISKVSVAAGYARSITVGTDSAFSVTTAS
jgi:hypothetical protein